jgi:hypothetical protein
MEVVAAFTERVSSTARKNRYQINVLPTARSGQLPFLGLRSESCVRAEHENTSLSVFALCQFTMDLEVAGRIAVGADQLHGFTNTLLGATVILVPSVLVGRPAAQAFLRWWNSRLSPSQARWMWISPVVSWKAAWIGSEGCWAFTPTLFLTPSCMPMPIHGHLCRRRIHLRACFRMRGLTHCASGRWRSGLWYLLPQVYSERRLTASKLSRKPDGLRVYLLGNAARLAITC